MPSDYPNAGWYRIEPDKSAAPMASAREGDRRRNAFIRGSMHAHARALAGAALWERVDAVSMRIMSLLLVLIPT